MAKEKTEEKYYDLSKEAISKFNNVFSTKSFPVKVGFQFVGNAKQKNMIKIGKLPDQYSYLLGKEILVQINEDLMDAFDDTSIKILMEQEIDKISINIESGKIKMVKADLTTFSTIVSKYGIDDVSKANSVEILYNEQKADKEKEDEFIV